MNNFEPTWVKGLAAGLGMVGLVTWGVHFQETLNAEIRLAAQKHLIAAEVQKDRYEQLRRDLAGIKRLLER